MGFSDGKAMAQHNELGRKGERAAVNYLESKGHHILEQNWRLHGYEIDIITTHGGYIVFVEVKTRASDQWGDPESFVGIQRMRRMIRAAHHYLLREQIDLPARFDIVSIIWEEEHCELEHIEDAFMAF
ncbi:MAG: YraN family protein [bacterium]|jgi:putative endonuclease|nr:YraN family protein [bacterium]MDD3624763.1 YraN family protein [Proteiniphilum sp.]MDD3968669.1 YraN family protein [Proteiniphilum sp.]MDD4459847.1 YraN family protein [Proteiniphilum sp.]